MAQLNESKASAKFQKHIILLSKADDFDIALNEWKEIPKDKETNKLLRSDKTTQCICETAFRAKLPNLSKKHLIFNNITGKIAIVGDGCINIIKGLEKTKNKALNFYLKLVKNEYKSIKIQDINIWSNEIKIFAMVHMMKYITNFLTEEDINLFMKEFEEFNFNQVEKDEIISTIFKKKEELNKQLEELKKAREQSIQKNEELRKAREQQSIIFREQLIQKNEKLRLIEEQREKLFREHQEKLFREEQERKIKEDEFNKSPEGIALIKRKLEEEIKRKLEEEKILHEYKISILKEQIFKDHCVRLNLARKNCNTINKSLYSDLLNIESDIEFINQLNILNEKQHTKNKLLCLKFSDEQITELFVKNKIKKLYK